MGFLKADSVIKMHLWISVEAPKFLNDILKLAGIAHILNQRRVLKLKLP